MASQALQTLAIVAAGWLLEEAAAAAKTSEIGKQFKF